MRYFLFVTLFFSACTSTSKNNVEVIYSQAADEDINYQKILKKNTKFIELYAAFETSYFINTSYFSPNFLKEFNSRKAKILSADMKLLDHEEDYFIFIVSIFSPNESLTNLSDKKQWAISLKVGNEKLLPTKVSFLKKEHPWNIFFNYINDWSNEYLVFFPKKEFKISGSSDNDLLSNIELTLASSQGKTSMKW